MDELENLRFSETILAFSYWENWGYYKTMAQSLGGKNPQVKRIEAEVNQIREEWHALKKRIEDIEHANGIHVGED